MIDRIKVIIKHPEEPVGRICEIENTLERFQRIVGGPIEVVPFADQLIICNEEGKLRGLQPNIRYLNGDMLVGTIICCGDGGEDFTDTSWTLQNWKWNAGLESL